MNENLIDTVKALFQSLQLTELEVKEGDFSLRLKKEERRVETQPVIMASQPEVRMARGFQPEEPQADAQYAYINCNEVKAPLVGVFYAASAPDAAPFVNVGDTVKKGDVLCIVEAMKMMNEITSEFDGKIIDICAENGKIVEYGQTLFKISKE